jgi:hypothetical protein
MMVMFIARVRSVLATYASTVLAALFLGTTAGGCTDRSPELDVDVNSLNVALSDLGGGPWIELTPNGSGLVGSGENCLDRALGFDEESVIQVKASGTYQHEVEGDTAGSVAVAFQSRKAADRAAQSFRSIDIEDCLEIVLTAAVASDEQLSTSLETPVRRADDDGSVLIRAASVVQEGTSLRVFTELALIQRRHFVVLIVLNSPISEVSVSDREALISVVSAKMTNLRMP